MLLIGLEGGSVVYQGKNFYEVDYTYAEKALFSLIERPPKASACATEKGTEAQIKATAKSKSTEFPPSSVFRELAEESLDAPFSCDVLICDDMGTECADFFAASFDKKQLALIHAKVGSGTQVSAAAFHEVASQAMKNLTYLTRNAEVPQGATSWRKDRYWKKTQISRLLQSPPGRQTATSLWNELKSDIIYSSNAELFVVLATAGCCDIGTLAKIVADPSQRTPETAQLVHLLDGLNSYARQLGVKLLIYDLPFVPKKKKKKKAKKRSAPT